MWDKTNGIIFGDKHSYRDWGLYLKSRPKISPPTPKTVLNDIPGADGSLDLTDALTGDVKFEDRKLEFEFKVIGGRDKWYDTFSDIQDYMHGKRMKIVIDEDPHFYYIGRVEVSEWESSEVTSTITIDVTADPYKLEVYSGLLEDWLWDPFNFETDIIREYKDLTVNGFLSVVIPGRRKWVVPKFDVKSDVNSSAKLKVKYKGNTYDLPDGSSRIVNIVLTDGENVLEFTGYGTISIDYRGGRL